MLKRLFILLLMQVFLISGIVFAQSNNAMGGIFNKDLPVSINALPFGEFRTALENLPEPAQQRALGWLRRFEFPAADIAFLRVDQRGGIFYEDPIHENAEAESEESSTPVLSEISQTEAFSLHSKPGASRTVYLDMNGHVITGTIWNNGTANSLYMRPYDTDGNESSFSQPELDSIAEVWKRVAEDYAPFDIDVTTEEPSSFNSNVGHILVTRKADEYGNEIYNCSCGGVAYVGVWGEGSYTYYQPALVFLDGVGSVHSISEAASHELGHNLGLSHDGSSTVGYYTGHGNGNTDWAPIMGVGYYANVTQWSKGEYLNANNQQDDLEAIRGHLSYRNDDHEDINFANATALLRSDATTISATNPVSDPGNFSPFNKGIIEDRSDIDLFYVDAGVGNIDLQISPAWLDNYVPHTYNGMNIDIQASLYDEAGNLITQDNPTNDTFATITASVSAGRYILAIAGVGVRTPVDGYSDYGSIGQYFINGTVPEDFIYTSAPVAPSDVIASLAGENNILLVWTDQTSTTESNEAAYYVYRQKEGETAVLIATLEKDSDSFADNNLANGSYVYQLEVYNSVGTDVSNTTTAINISAPVSSFVSSETTITGLVSSGSYLDTANDIGSEILSEVHQGGRPTKRVSALEHIWNITGIEPGSNISLDINVEAPANNEGDDFIFSYAVNGDGAFINFATLENGTGSQTLSAILPLNTQSLEIHVIDTDQSPGRGVADTITVHRIEVISGGEPGDQAPVVNISEPLDGHQAAMEENIIFSATATDFEDDDSSLNIIWTSDGTGIGNGNSISISDLTIGAHVITASVTDSADKAGTDTITVTITDPDAAVYMHIADLADVAEQVRNKWSATVTTTVHDNKGAPVSDAIVTGEWVSGAKGTDSCTTGALGTCSITKGGLKTSVPSVGFIVTGIEHTTLDDDGSGITTITVTSP
ncbi:MAG: hypothetical protein KZQ83_03445 [gamma proteobacterium symbiont of Taylorina sp.]|nr:hypothetical protein [gamma proteobacterium symbiont of Taylorina sp.]